MSEREEENTWEPAPHMRTHSSQPYNVYTNQDNLPEFDLIHNYLYNIGKSGISWVIFQTLG